MGIEAITTEELREEDRLSQLPVDIIHTILHRLDSPKTAASFSLLSKRWLEIWRSYPVLEFYSWEFATDRYSGICQKKLAQFVPALPVKCRGIVAGALHAFRVYISMNLYRERRDHEKNIHELLSFLTANALFPSEFEFTTEPDPCYHNKYSLPVGTFSNWTRSRVLKLRGCSFFQLGNPANPEVPNKIDVGLSMLKTLHLKSVRLDEGVLESFLANAPLLRTLKLVQIEKVQRLAIVSAPSLKTLIVRKLDSLVEIELPDSAPELETVDVANVPKFELTGTPLSRAAPNIRVLNLGPRECVFTLAELADLIYESPSLESVFLGPKRKTKEQNRSQSKRQKQDEYIHRSRGYELHDVKIDGLSLKGFKVFNRASDGKCVVDLNMYWDDFKVEWFVGLRRFFSTVYSQSRRRVTFKLSYLYLKSDEVPWKLKKEPENASLLPPPSIHLMELAVAYVWDMKTAKAFIDGLLWMCRPEFVLINSDEISEERCWELMSRDHVSKCCDGANLCWRHDAKDVKRINGTVEMMEMMAADEAQISPQGFHCFRLTW